MSLDSRDPRQAQLQPLRRRHMILREKLIRLRPLKRSRPPHAPKAAEPPCVFFFLVVFFQILFLNFKFIKKKIKFL